MAELLVQRVDQDQPDPALNSYALKAGDVITIQPDGWGWTQAELTNPDWVIISAPLLQTHINTLLSAPSNGALMATRQRNYNLDLSVLGISPTTTSPTTSTQTTGVQTITPPTILPFSDTDIINATVQKP